MGLIVQTLLIVLILAVAVGFLARRAVASAQSLRASSRPGASGAGCATGCGCGESAQPRRWDELSG